MNGNQFYFATKRRSAFTLIELLVVIAIIAILAGLTLAAVMTFFVKGPQLQNRNDVLQISEGLQSFKTKYGRYPPDKIRLRANLADYRNKRIDVLDDESISFIQSVMWKDLGSTTGGVTNIPWAGNTPMPANGNGIVLEGDQCLVFFVGGPPIGGGQVGLMGGFSTNPLDPIDLSKTNPNRQKYFDFEAGRLFNRAGNPFPSYLDVYRVQPWLYFSSNKRPNGYNTMPNSLGVRPYAKNAAMTEFYMPDSFQLISAGADGKFGPGGIWTEANAAAIPAAGKDDITNFYDKMMGIP